LSVDGVANFLAQRLLGSTVCIKNPPLNGLQKENRREARLASRRIKSYVLNASLERDRPNVQSVAESVARLIVDVLNVGPLQQDIELSDALQHLRNRLTIA
jgi:hypothetical protein